MPLTIADEFQVCHDCACVMANGECVVMTADGYADHADRMIPYALGVDYALACERDGETGEDLCDSSSVGCRGCGTTEYGWRHPAVTFAQAPPGLRAWGVSLAKV